MILVTCGAGFIGGNSVLDWLKEPTAEGIVNFEYLVIIGVGLLNRLMLMILQRQAICT